MYSAQAYSNLVYARAATIERVLKLVCTEDDMLEETFQLLWPDGTKEDLDAVKNLKGSGNVALDEIKNVASQVRAVFYCCACACACGCGSRSCLSRMRCCVAQVGVDKAGQELKKGAKVATDELKDFGRFVKDDIKNIFTGKIFDDPVHPSVASHGQHRPPGAGAGGGAGGAPRPPQAMSSSSSRPPGPPGPGGGSHSNAAAGAAKKAGDSASKAMGEIKSAFGSFGSLGQDFNLFGGPSSTTPTAGGARKPQSKS